MTHAESRQNGIRRKATGLWISAGSVRSTSAGASRNVAPNAKIYTDESRAYEGLNREAVRHSVGEYVRGQAHTNGMESFWALLKRGFYGVYHRMSPKHLHRYVQEFSGRHNERPKDTIDQLSAMVRGMCGKRLTYEELIG